MNYTELVEQFRVDADDRVKPYLVSELDLLVWLGEAEEEAAIRARLIREVSNTALCNIAVTAGTNIYPLHEAVVWVTRAVFIPTGSTEAQSCPISLVDDTELDRLRSAWRTTTEQPEFLMVFDTSVQLGCLPIADGLLKMEVCRVPLEKIEDRATESPEINRAHHRHLVQWALHKCYARPDSQIYDPDRATRALAQFEAIFGLRVDAKLRRDSEANRHHSNKAW